MRTELSSRGNTVSIGPDLPFVVIGERINPTGRKKLGPQMAAGDFTAVRRDAERQFRAGAQVLDVNAGYPMGDELEMLRGAARAAQQACGVPLCLDSARPEVLDAALAVCEGKALVNSVTGEEERLQAVLPLVRKYGSAVIGIVSDKRGIPAEPRERLAVGRRILARAQDYGIPAADVILDPICLAIATDPESGRVTLETIRLIRDELGVNTCCGAGNVGFGLPDRPALSAAFLAMSISWGLTSAIADATNPATRDAVLAADLLLGRDTYAVRWLAHYREKQNAASELVRTG